MKWLFASVAKKSNVATSSHIEKQESKVFVGDATLCLRVNDLDRAIRFYGALGLSVVPNTGVPRQSVVVGRGRFRIFLMANFGRDSINFRGADAFEVEEHLKVRGLRPDGEGPVRQEDGGSGWMIDDPDGHGVFFNTHAPEMALEHRKRLVAGVLRDALQDLVDLGASEELLRALRKVSEQIEPSAAKPANEQAEADGGSSA